MRINVLIPIAHPDALPHSAAMKAAFDEASKHCPPNFRPGDGIVLLPRRPLTDRCRLCGKNERLTKEHVPPKAAGNSTTRPSLTLAAWLAAENRRQPQTKTRSQGGVWGYTLCASCNSYTGRQYGSEYMGWAIRACGIIQQLPPVAALDAQPDAGEVEVTFGGNKDGGVSPGAFVRQVLSCMCTVSASWDLAGQHPAIRRMVLEGAEAQLPAGVHLGMTIFLGPITRCVGPTFSYDAQRNKWAWIMEVAYPPFAFKLVLASDEEEPDLGLVLNPFTELDPRRRVRLTAPLRIGFGRTPYPTDYRTGASVEMQRHA
ncbi:MAG: hypothetical protein IPN34_21485 [Planctomycetes bacterium]|nr:hypothetical protein [Planctomycetota bacterium]